MSDRGDAGDVMVAVPNVSEGTDTAAIDRFVAAVNEHATVLDVHSDPEYNRSVISAAGTREQLVEGMSALAGQIIGFKDMRGHTGVHPNSGALDVCPIVYLGPHQRSAARAAAAEVGERIAALDVPVFFYGELASSPERSERAFFRRGGPAELARRVEHGDVSPDLGPLHVHPSAGATLVTAREPLVAFNLELGTSNPEVARVIAGELRESGGGLEGVRALGIPLEGGRTQVTMNIHHPSRMPLAKVIDAAKAYAQMHGIEIISAELIGLVPEAGMEGYPEDVPIKGFDPERHILERRLAAAL